MAFLTVARVAEVPPGTSLAREVGGVRFALHHLGSRFYATQDTCCGRASGRLSQGTLHPEDGTVSCPLHEWKFDLATGRFFQSPWVYIKTYPVRIQGDEVQVDVG